MSKRNTRRQKRRQISGGNRGQNRRTTTQRRASAPVATTSIIRNRGVAKSVRIRHKEFITDLSIPDHSGVFSRYEINPGLEATFPWLSAIAQRFESYQFNTLLFHYVPSVPTSTAGSLIICPDYDAADINDGASKSELLSFEDSVRGAWWTQFTLRCSPQNLRKRKTYYVRGQVLGADLDIKTYDTLQLNLMKSGEVANDSGGELWVEYDVTLITPQRKPEGQPLGQTGASGSVYHDTGAFTWINTFIYNVLDSETEVGGDALAISTPGVYLFNMISRLAQTALIQIPNNLHVSGERASILTKLQQTTETDNIAPAEKWMYSAIWDIGTTAPYNISTAYLHLNGEPGTYFQTGVGNHWMDYDMYLLLPGDPLREEYLKWKASGMKTPFKRDTSLNITDTSIRRTHKYLAEQYGRALSGLSKPQGKDCSDEQPDDEETCGGTCNRCKCFS